MSGQWYYKLNGESAGPFSRQELSYLVSRGKLSAEDLVRQGKSGEWMNASHIGGLFPAAAEATSVAPAVVSSSPAAQPAATHTESSPANSMAARTRTSAATRPKPPPPPASGPSRPQRILIGAGITTAALLLILLLLLLLLRRDSGSDVAGRGTSDGAGDTNSQGKDAGEGDSADGTGGAGNGGAEGEDVSGGSGHGGPSGDGDNADSGNADDDNPRPLLPVIEGEIGIEPVSPATTQGGGSGNTGRFSGSGSGGGGSSGGGRGDGDFFGLKAKGNKIVYIVDCSGSMSGEPFKKACDELLASIGRLRRTQSVYVFFFASQTFPMFYPTQEPPKLLRATSDNVERIEKWVREFNGGGGTDPRDALLQSLALKPDTIFLLTDGGFDAGVETQVTQQNQGRVVINTVGFMYGGGEYVLRPLAENNRGKYRLVQ